MSHIAFVKLHKSIELQPLQNEFTEAAGFLTVSQMKKKSCINSPFDYSRYCF